MPSNKGSGNTVTQDAIAIWKAGVKAVAADSLVESNINLLEENGRTELLLGDVEHDISSINRLLVVGAGKAGTAMAIGLERKWTDLVQVHPVLSRIKLEGVVNVPSGTVQPLRHIELIEARPAGVNEPTDAGIVGSHRMMQLVQTSDQRTGCIVLLSGGGSALLPLPAEGIGLQEKLAVTRLLSASGATIDQLNTVRKQLSAIKGGKLARSSNASWMHTLVISDVLGDPLDLIASGPTVQDSSTPAEALAILERFDSSRQLPSSIYRLLESKASRWNDPSEKAESYNHRSQITIIGNNAVAVDGAGMEAEHRGYNHAMLSAKSSEGQAEDVGENLARMAITMLQDSGSTVTGSTVNCLITGGEPVVRLAPQDIRGKGGRNQQLVLSVLRHWMNAPENVQNELKRRVAILSGGTDGEDGPTDAAGAYIDGEIWENALQLKLDPADYLARNDAYSFFEKVGGLLITGPTGTNVCDIRVMTIGTR